MKILAERTLRPCRTRKTSSRGTSALSSTNRMAQAYSPRSKRPSEALLSIQMLWEMLQRYSRQKRLLPKQELSARLKPQVIPVQEHSPKLGRALRALQPLQTFQSHYLITLQNIRREKLPLHSPVLASVYIQVARGPCSQTRSTCSSQSGSRSKAMLACRPTLAS